MFNHSPKRDATRHASRAVEHFAICTILVVLGKALNFVLFCLSSASFRQRLLMQTKQGILRKSTRYSSVATHM
uniref:Uncharacterized protein n=1 Tax=Caenorhabditis japonica TaxID=281687 RepID=A0A8R1EF92_CAEJA